MAVTTWLDITTEDFQGYQATLPFRIVPAAFGATTLPTAAKIEAVINALYGDTKFSDQRVIKYAVRVEQDVPGATGGAGNVTTSEALRMRSGDGDSLPALWRVPGLMKANVTFDPQNPNGVATVGALWTALRDALTDAEIAVSAPEGAYAAYTEEQIAVTANAFDGRRAPLRPR